ncbi:hypothetical protein [Chryseobacterium foetidum]|uniref:hypothetical protein n=1 Tax=Chryseobacterium foetidum TaxID=2951057 RepID=UPI0021CA0111|nr:hypothetical protein [Chryseobacterium foetidum]
MSNFFTLNEALNCKTYDMFLNYCRDLVAIERLAEDQFLKHNSIFDIPHITQLYSNYSNQDEAAIAVFIEQLKPHSIYLDTEAKIDANFPGEDNGFLGGDFIKTSIIKDKQIKNNDDYANFNSINLWRVNFRNFWTKRNRLFPNLTFCGEVKNQILKIGKSSHFNQIIDRLKEFDAAVSKWDKGDFSYRDINNKYSLRISPETNQTMSNYGNERLFSLPEGGTEYFELHIKTGDLRFHFFPQNKSRKVFVGYIGPHLTI